MPTMRTTLRRRHAPLAALVIALGGAGLAAPAGAQGRFSVDTSASVGIASNPVLTDNSGLAASGTISVAPSYSWNDAFSQFSISGQATLSEYSSDVGSNNSISLAASGNHRLSDMLSINATLAYINSIVGAFNGFSVPVTPVVPVDPGTGPVVTTPIVVPPIDNLPAGYNNAALGLFGRRQQTYSATGGIGAQISARDQLSASVAVNAARLPGQAANTLFAANDFNSVSPSLTYSRSFNPRLSGSLGMSVVKTDYLGTRLGDALIYQPTIGVQRVLNERWTLGANAGAAISQLEGLNGTFTSTSFMGSASLCRKDDRTNACIVASRQTLPSSIGGVRNSTSVSANAGYLLTEADQLSFGLIWSHSSAPLVPEAALFNTGSTKYLSASATLNHRFNSRASAFASGYVSKADDDFLPRNRSIEVRVGASYRFGRTQ